MSDEEVRDFLGEKMVMQCATTGPRGLPHMVPLWFVADGPELRGWTYAKSQKARNLEREPRATLGLEDGVQYHELRGVMFECDVGSSVTLPRSSASGSSCSSATPGELTDDIRAMVAKQAQKRVGLTFVPTRTVSWDHRKLHGAY